MTKDEIWKLDATVSHIPCIVILTLNIELVVDFDLQS